MDGSAGLFMTDEWLNWTYPSWVQSIATQVSWGPEHTFFPLTHFLSVVPHTVQSRFCRFLLLRASFWWGCLDNFNSCLSSEYQFLVWGWLSLPHCNNASFLSFCWRFAGACLQTWSGKSPFHHSSSSLPALPAQHMLPAASALWQNPQASEIPGDRAAQAEETACLFCQISL